MTDINPDAGPCRFRARNSRQVPAGSIWVGYGSRWANPWEYHAKVPYQNGRSDVLRRIISASQMAAGRYRDEMLTKGRVIVPATRFRAEIVTTIEDVKRELAGRNLTCTCYTDRACHGDVLLEIANDWPAPAMLLGRSVTQPSLVIQEAVRKIEQVNRRYR